jgi:hypothetical protein
VPKNNIIVSENIDNINNINIVPITMSSNNNINVNNKPIITNSNKVNVI